ncbi:MAG TPA: DUF6701 domain-containing protein [Burkholderiaceae bacterium]|nr:DUF6701 domain-containing protein [Burkholderiaceae bacterium]
MPTFAAWIAGALIAAVMLVLPDDASAQASLSSTSSQTFTVGQASTAASTMTVTDDFPATITAANDLRIRIPAGFNMTWDTTVTTVTLSGTASGKVSTTLNAYEDSGRTLVLDVTADFAGGDTLTISGLKFTNFTAPSASNNLQLVVAGAGGATADTDFRTKTVQVPTPTLSSANSQVFTVGEASTAASNMTVTDDPNIPSITAANGLRIRIPAGFNMTWDTTVTTVTLTGSASGKVSTTLGAYENSGQTLVLNVTSNFTAGQTLTISGPKFTNFTAASASNNLQVVVAGAGGATANTDNRTKTIQVPTPTLSSAASQTFAVGQASTAASNMTVTDDPNVPAITVANGLRIRIPAGFPMTWDTTVTTVTLSGTASAKVSTTLGAYEDSGQTLVLNVTSNFAAGQTLTISGPKLTSFTATGFTNLQLVTAGAGGATASTDNRWKTIGQSTLSSSANQTFVVGQAATAASNMTVQEDGNVTTITSAQGLRIRIPAGFNMTWDTTVTTVTLSGSASGRVSTTLGAYEDGGQTLVLTVTSNFQTDDTLTISGLRFANFTAVSAANNLQLVVSGAGGATESTDNKTKTIVGIKLYFHDAATPDLGTLPGATTLSATTPNVTATTAGTNRDMNQTIGAAQASSALTVLGQTTLQKNWFRRFLSRPLAAQTLPTGTWSIQGGASESSSNANMLPWGTVLKVWRPSTGTVVATLLDNPTLGTVKPNTSETNISSTTGSISGVAVNDGDILVVELWAQNTQSNSNPHTNTIFYDGTTEGSTSSNAAFLQAPAGINFYRGTIQYDYRLFNNANSTDVGTALAAQDTSATLASTGAAFRLRMLLHVSDVNLGASGQAFKLQFAGMGAGTCAAPSGGTPATYTDVTASTAIAYNDNPAPANGAALTADANDPTHSGDTVVDQTYSESNNVTNPTAINAGQDGEWDFSLIDNGASASTTYCLRAVKSTGTALDSYSYYPQITTAAGGGGGGAGSFNAFETATAAGAVAGRIFTKLAGTAFSLDVVAISAGAQLNSFSNNVQLQLLANTGTAGTGYGSDNCPTSNSVVGTVSSAAITGGRSTVSFSAVANAYRDVRVRISYPTSSPTVSTCSTDSFAIRPTGFSSLTSSMTNGGSSGTPKAKAGDAFTLTAVAGAGYDGTPSINASLVTAQAGAVQVGAIGGSFAAAASGSGTSTGSAFTYSEVGNFTLGVDAVFDSGFTSIDPAGTDCTNDFSNSLVGGKYGCSFGNTGAAGPFGRFTPDHFDVSMNTPAFGTACSGFTYVGQNFSYTTVPVLTLTARNSAALGNATTHNYIGPNDGSSWWKITAASLTGKAYSQLPASPALTASPSSPDPVIAPGGNGTGTLTFNSGTGFSFSRGSPVASFNAELALAINVIDADGIAYAGNPAQFGAASAGSGIAFNSSKNMLFGELAVGSGAGLTSQIVQIPVKANIWNGSGWVTNTADTCTGPVLAQASIVVGNQVQKPGTGGTFSTSVLASPSLASTWSQGSGYISLSPPNVGGTAQVAINLGSGATDTSCAGWSVTSTGAALPWLRGPWCGSGYTNDPSSLAIFGLASSTTPFVFLRENH